MRIKNAFRILVGDANVIYKAVFYRLIITSILGVIGYFTLGNLLMGIFTKAESVALWDEILKLVTNPLHAKPIEPDSLKIAFEAFLAMLKNNMSTIYITIIGVVLFLIVFKLVNRIGNFGIAYLYNGYMSSLTKFSLTSAILPNFGKAVLYSLIIVPITLIYDGLVIITSVLIVVYGIGLVSVFAIIWSIIFAIFAFGLKYAFLSNFLPAIVVENKKIGQAFVDTFKKRKNFITLLGNYAFVIMFSFYFNVSVCLFTVGVGLFVSLPIASLFMILISMVSFYNEKGKKYYVDADSVIVPKQLHENADLLKYM